jgi:hypothetical protein
MGLVAPRNIKTNNARKKKSRRFNLLKHQALAKHT